MDPIENERATARELVSFAQERDVDLETHRNDDAFDADQRFIILWRQDGVLHYNMQGSIALLPRVLKDSASAFRRGWHESGSFDSIEQAFEFVKAWIIDTSEVDDLPPRHVRQYGI